MMEERHARGGRGVGERPGGRQRHSHAVSRALRAADAKAAHFQLLTIPRKMTAWGQLASLYVTPHGGATRHAERSPLGAGGDH